MFFREAEPRLRHALVASCGPDVGREAAADALAYGWEHWDRVGAMENPAGYLYRVGRNAARQRRRRVAPEQPSVPIEPWVEPALDGALGRLTVRQRTAVLLLHTFDWTHAEVADLLGVSVPTVQKHAARGLVKLRRALGVDDA
jgi:DNA-directed RNA polymerase specialized sigma24 family protein